MNNIRIGVAGIGSMGTNHCKVLQMVGSADFVGIFDIDKGKGQAAADLYHVRVFPSYREMLRQVDAVIIAVPTTFHYPYLMEAIQEGKHVLVEKPLSGTAAEAKDIAKCAETAKMIIQVGHIERFNPAIQRVAQIAVPQQIRRIEAKRANRSARDIDVDVILDLMIHDIDIVLHLVQSPVSVVSAHGVSHDGHRQWDIVTALLQFENGVIASLVADRTSQAKIRSLEIVELNRTIAADLIARNCRIFRSITEHTDGNPTYPLDQVTEQVSVPFANPLYEEIVHFLTCIRTGEPPAVGVLEGTQALELAFRIREATDKT